MTRSNLIVIVLAAVTAFAMFAVSYRVKDLEDELASVERSRVLAERSIHVLNAEWSFLTRPDRLTDLARRHLALAPVAAGQVVAFDAIPRPGALAAAVPDAAVAEVVLP